MWSNKVKFLGRLYSPERFACIRWFGCVELHCVGSFQISASLTSCVWKAVSRKKSLFHVVIYSIIGSARRSFIPLIVGKNEAMYTPSPCRHGLPVYKFRYARAWAWVADECLGLSMHLSGIGNSTDCAHQNLIGAYRPTQFLRSLPRL